MEATKLEKLLIEEVSGVDAPANEIPGFMIMKAEGEDAHKASKFKTGRSMGPEQSWDVGDAEKRVRAATDAEDAPNADYASCFLWFDSEAPDKFGSYKFLVVDVVDGELKVMPQALRAAASRLPGSKLSDSDKASVGTTLDKLKAKAGIGEAAEKSTDGEDAPQTTLAKIKNLLWPARKDEVEMTSDELKAALDERDAALVEKFAEVVKSAAPSGEAPAATTELTEAPAAPATDPESAAETATALTEDDITKAVEAALAPYNDILEKTLDRIERIETAFGIAARKSLDGQETEGSGEVEKTTTPQGKTEGIGIAKALFDAPIGTSIGSFQR